MRELTSEEQAFVDESLSKTRAKENTVKRVKTKQEAKRKTKSKVLRNVIVTIMIIPFLMIGIISYNLNQVSALIGTENMEVLVKNKNTPEFVSTAEGIGLDWLPQFLIVYSYKEIIFAIIIAVFIVISAIVLISHALLTKLKGNESNEKNQD